MASFYTRRSFISHLGLFGCAPTNAQYTAGPIARSRRIGFLIGMAPTLITAFEEELRRLGYVDGKNLVIEKRISRSNTSDLGAQAAELSQMDLDLIVAAALPRALVARADRVFP